MNTRNSNARNVAVIAPHPDDETLGCGGTLLAHRQHGDTLHWIVATQLDANQSAYAHRIETRKEEIKKVAEVYGFEKTHFAKFPTATLDKVGTSELIEKFRAFFEEIQPHTLYVPYPHDIHTDHYCVFQAALSAAKWFRLPCLKRVLAYETLSETDFAAFFASPAFSANCYVDISNQLERKIEIMKMYDGEMGQHPFPRSPESIRALATLRGAQGGFQSAEAFLLIRESLSFGDGK